MPPAGPAAVPDVTPEAPSSVPDLTPETPPWGPEVTEVVEDFLDAEFPCVEEEDWQQAVVDELYRELWAYVDWAETGFVQGEDGSVAPALQLTQATLDRLNEGTLVLICPEATETATVEFSLLSSEAGYLNEATLFVNGRDYDFGNSDMGAGFSFEVEIEVSPFAMNQFDIAINTWKRWGDWIPGLDTRNGQGFELIGANDSWGGRSDSVAKIKDLSLDGQLHMVVGYEDLIMTGDTPDWDYNDFVFEFRADRPFNFTFGYDLYGDGSQGSGDDDDGSQGNGDDDGDSQGGGDGGSDTLPPVTQLPKGIKLVIYALADGSTYKATYTGNEKDPTNAVRYIEAIQNQTGQAVVGYTIKAKNNQFYDEYGNSADAVSTNADYSKKINKLDANDGYVWP
jgi:hypothetical protein